MNEHDSTISIQFARTIVLVERHLQAELGLLEDLDALNQTLKVTLEAAGSRGLSGAQTNNLNQMATELSQQSSNLKLKRSKTLDAINEHFRDTQDRLTIRQFIQTLDPANASRLESIRMAILDRLTDAHATLIGNQAVMFYSYDFYRKMVSGLLNNDLDENQYSLTGQQTSVKPGNLYRKVC